MAAPAKIKVCKTAEGWRTHHTLVVEDHPSIPSVKIEVCPGCRKVKRWLPA